MKYIAIYPKGRTFPFDSITELLDALQRVQKFPFDHFSKPTQVNPKPSRGTTQRLRDSFEFRIAYSRKEKPLFAVYGHVDPKRLTQLDPEAFNSTKAERVARKRDAKKRR